MRFVLVSTHIDQTTGYSKVVYNLIKQSATLSPKVKTFHFGFQRHPGRLSIHKYPEGVVSYDAAANEDPKEEGFGFNKIHEYLDMVNPDVVMIYNDPIIIYKFIEAMKHEPKKSTYKLWLYIDQVYNGIAQPLIDRMNQHADRIYCFTDMWKKKYLTYGEHPDIRVLGHAVDPSIFTNLPIEARHSQRSGLNIPTDGIVFLNANRNSQRKRLDVTIQGFVRLLVRNPSAPYYLLIATHLNPQVGAYYDLSRIFQEELTSNGLELPTYASRFLLVDTAPPNVISDEGINTLYNIADIGINTSDGEGFGLCQLEHMYTGAPQVVTDIGSYRTFLDETVAEFIPQGHRIYQSGAMPLGCYAPTFSPDEVCNAMERTISKLPEKKRSVNKFQFQSWAKVCDEWLEDLLTASST